MKIVTNNHKHEFLYQEEVPAEIMKDQFSHLDNEISDGFVKYRDYYYHTADFSLVSKYAVPPLSRWDGFISETAFSGVVIKIVDSDTYIIGRYWT